VTRLPDRRNLLCLLLVTLVLGVLAWGPPGAISLESADPAGEPPSGLREGGRAAEPSDAAGERSLPEEHTPEGDGPTEAEPCRPTAEALLVRGVGMLERQAIQEGLEVIAGIIEERPTWAPALAAEAGAVLRSGRFAEAADGYSALLGAETARALARGDLDARDLAVPIDPEHVLGLAIARHYLGDHREADRLYRSYADLVEPTSERAARAYWRLSEMYSEIDVSWGDPEAERAKALATDPSIESKLTLPEFPDVRAIAETEPYTREIALAPDRSAPEGGVESLPVLIDWTPPAFEDLDADAEWKTGAVEVLVDVSGHTEDLALPFDLDLGSGPGGRLAQAAMAWCFEPAVGESGTVAAWITLGVDVPVTARPDSLAAAGPDTADLPEEGAPQDAIEVRGDAPPDSAAGTPSSSGEAAP
jgi:hypothetical protein